MDPFSIDHILKVARLKSELELERANALFNKLRLLVKDNPSLQPVRKHLANLIEAYEAAHWADEKKVTKAQLQASDRAERIVDFQERFIQQRKKRIREALKKKGLIQNDLAMILGHGKSYMSELINGVRPFSQDDIVIIHRILGIRLLDLINPVIKERAAERIRLAIRKLNKPSLKLTDKDLDTIGLN